MAQPSDIFKVFSLWVEFYMLLEYFEMKIPKYFPGRKTYFGHFAGIEKTLAPNISTYFFKQAQADIIFKGSFVITQTFAQINGGVWKICFSLNLFYASSFFDPKLCARFLVRRQQHLPNPAD